MSTILNIIYFVLILGVIVLVHELGHLIAAKKFGVYCKEFSIGMGPVLWKKQGAETQWSIRALPLGGFVAMVGENEDDEDDAKLDVPYERTLPGIAKWKQVIVMAAGAFMNIMLAWALFIGVTAAQGAVAVESQAIIEKLEPNGVAEQAGFMPGDKIIKMETADHQETISVKSDVTMFLQFYPGETTFVVERNGEEVRIVCEPTYSEENQAYLMGVYFPTNELKEISLFEAIPYGTQRLVDSAFDIFDSLGKIVTGVGLNQLSGPVGIFEITSEVTQTGWISTLALVALLSINVGIFNLIPIPNLDGGRILILLIEAIIGRKLNENLQTTIMMIGLLLILGIMVFATWNDITRIFL